MTRGIIYDIAMKKVWRTWYVCWKRRTLVIYVLEMDSYMCRMMMLEEENIMTKGHHKEIILIYCSFWFLSAFGWVVIGPPKESCISHLQLVLMRLDERSLKRHELRKVVVWSKSRWWLRSLSHEEKDFITTSSTLWFVEGKWWRRWSMPYEEALDEEGSIMKKLKFMTW